MPREKQADSIAPLISRTLIEGIQAIQHRKDVPDGFDGNALRAYIDLGAMLGKNISAMELTANGDSVTVSETMSRNAEAILDRKEYAFGTLSGRLEKINLHNNQNVFSIYPIVGPSRGVKCSFGRGLTHKAAEALTHFVDVQGRLIYNAIDALPEEIQVQEIYIREEPVPKPKLGDLQGMAPGATGDSQSEDFIGELRDGWE